MHSIRYMQPPALPHRSEFAEVNDSLQQGLSLDSGYRRTAPWPETFDVGGVLLARPFKVSKIGPVRIFVDDVDAALDFYGNTLGLTLTQELQYEGHRCLFFRANTEHHALAVYAKGLRSQLGLAANSSLMGFGVQLGSYAQLRGAVDFLSQAGVRFKQLPQALFPGVGPHVWAVDPDGNLVQLHWEMEQIGWDGQARPEHLRRAWPSDPAQWPATLAPQSDSFLGEVFLGPIN